MKRICLLLLGVLILFSFGGCKKIQERTILTGEWEFKSAYMNHDDATDILNLVLPYRASYPEDSYYQILFDDDGSVHGKYYTFDTLNYAVDGEWELVKYNVFKVNLDQYVNGTFIVDKMKDGNYKLTSDEDSNAVKFLGNAKVYLEMNFHREKRED